MQMGNRAGSNPPTWDTPPGIDGPLPISLVVTSQCVPKTFLISPIDSTPTSGSGPLHRLPPFVQPHTAPPATRAASVHDKTLGLFPIPPAISESVLPSLRPLRSPLSSYRRGRPLRNIRPDPWAHDDTLRPVDHPSGSPRCLLSAALRRRSLRSLLQLRGPMRRLHSEYVNVAFRYHVMSCVPCAIQSCSILSPCYTALREPLCSRIALSQLPLPHLTCTSDYWRQAVTPFLSAGLSTHRRPLRYLFSRGL